VTTTTLHIDLDVEGDREAAAQRLDALLDAIREIAPDLGAHVEATHVDRLRPVPTGGAR
jgi:hypothetical protein